MKLKGFLLIVSVLVSGFAFSQQDIFDAARFGTIDDVKELIAKNPDTINVVDASGYSPLTLACYRGNDKVAIFLASKVEDIDGESKYGTPLMAAVYKNREAVVKVLLEHGADPNLADANGTSPLHYAIIMRNKTIIKQLVEAKADMSTKDNRGNTAIDYANMTQDEEIINLIVK